MSISQAKDEAEILHNLKLLELEAAPLEPNANERSCITKAFVAYSEEFLENIETAKAFDANVSASVKIESSCISETGGQLEDLLQELYESVINPGLNPASGGHLGFIPGGGIYSAAWGDYVAAVANSYAGMRLAGPGAVALEHKLIHWMGSLFWTEGHIGGTLCSGGSIANLVAVCTARDATSLKLNEYHRLVIYLSHQTHHCVQKALRIAGLSDINYRYIPTDDFDRMRVDSLEQQILWDLSQGLCPWLVVASAGTTDTGAVDQLKEIGHLARKHKIWYHVDAAYGGFFKLLPEMQILFEGIEMADSIVVDPHKGLFLPYGLGAVLVKDVTLLYKSHYYKAHYLQDAYLNNDAWSPADLSPELTRHFRALRMWIPLKLHGLAPFKSALREKILLARYASFQLQKIPEIELRLEPQLSVVCFRVRSVFGDEKNLHLAEYFRSDGRIFISSTQIEGLTYLRFAILCFRTHLDKIEIALSIVKDFCNKLTNS